MGSLPPLMPRLPAGASRAGRMDRLAWRAGACFAAHGVRIGVRSNDPRVIELLPSLLPPGSQPEPSSIVDEVFSVWVRTSAGRPERRIRIYDGTTRLGRSRELSRALPALESALRLKVAETSPEHIFVHAGVVAWRGHAILVPGRSRSGKTTLVAALVKAGATYLSDEFAPLDQEGHVHPFAKPLTIRTGGCDVHARRCRAEDLGGSVGQAAMPVGLVAFAEHHPGASWQPTTLTHGQGVLEMLAHTVPARLRPAAALEALDRALAGATLLSGARGEADATARRLIETLEGRVPAPAASREDP
jgi:hypothetical protein